MTDESVLSVPLVAHFTSEAKEIAIAYLTHNTNVAHTDVGAVVRDIYAAVASPMLPEIGATAVRGEPAVPVEDSISHDYIVCLEDGSKLRMLKRHLRERYGMTPEQYREKWNLPRDYPMVAPAYSEHRSALAKEQGLGHKPEATPKPARRKSR